MTPREVFYNDFNPITRHYFEEKLSISSQYCNAVNLFIATEWGNSTHALEDSRNSRENCQTHKRKGIIEKNPGAEGK